MAEIIDLTEIDDMEEMNLLEPTEEETITLTAREEDSDEEESGDNDAEEDELNELHDENDAENEQAQTVFNTLMNEQDKRLSEIIVSNSLKGPLDFAVLQKMGFDCVKKIVFQKRGKITRLQNLPKDLVVLECSQQALSDLGVLPPLLEELNVEDNHLTELDLSFTPKLKKLNVSNNRLFQLENIPTDLEELYADGNDLQNLDLANCQGLKVLHLSRNTEYITLLHFPAASLVDFQHENTAYSSLSATAPDQEKAKKTKKRTIVYADALENYYEWKSKYEGAKKKCPKCEQTGGIVFSVSKNRLYARCGNEATPCNLKAQLFRGEYKNKQEHVNELVQESRQVGDEIIRVGLDVAFEYIHETQATAKFAKLKEKMQLLETEKDKLKTDTSTKEEVLAETRRQIENLLQILKADAEEYKKTKNTAVLERMTQLQIQQYMPLLEKERNLKWEHTEVVIFGKSNQEYGGRLVHYETGGSTEDLLVGEPPSVIEWVGF